jgi:hypothetical protein
MMVQPKNHDSKSLRICVDFRGLNKWTLINPFPTPFADEIINEIMGNECYSFTNKFSRYNQVPIAIEYQPNTTFIFKFGSFSHRLMPFGLKISPVVFSMIAVKDFQEYIYKMMVFYFDK